MGDERQDLIPGSVTWIDVSGNLLLEVFSAAVCLQMVVRGRKKPIGHLVELAIALRISNVFFSFWFALPLPRLSIVLVFVFAVSLFVFVLSLSFFSLLLFFSAFPSTNSERERERERERPVETGSGRNSKKKLREIHPSIHRSLDRWMESNPPKQQQ